ncbi:MAG: galactosyldiacylglycerol synthase [Ardenticatenales bacterium]|nr:galactosyldiacylglycerol synthase [Ardenticatenales bacterium]
MPHILILMSDTGGGHRAAAEAIQHAIGRLDDKNEFTVELLDFIKETAIPPWDRLGRIYKPAVDHASWLWGAGFKATSPWPIRKSLTALNATVAGPKMMRLLRKHPADLVVSVHPLSTSVPGRILRRIRPEVPFVIVVTDLVTTHPFWYWKGADATYVASEEARDRALRLGVPASKIEITGLPIDVRFQELPDRKEEMKREYGMPTDRAMLLLIGGGEGMGNLEGFARAIASSGLPLSLMVVAGRNEKLRRRLSTTAWEIPVQVTGFVRDMPRRMAAADVLITKAGPGTLCEGLAARLPIFITGFIPGQEEGNVRWITENNAGRLTLTPDDVTIALHGLFDKKGPTPLYDDAQEAAARLARPEAAITVAERLMALASGALTRKQDNGKHEK